LRVLLTYLAEETQAQRIHIIGYSAGTRLVITALHQPALMNAAPGADARQTKPPIGQVILIDVTDAEAATAGNGHAYFRQSPWVSSDILTSLLYGLEPGKRGLVRLPGAPVWSFPVDYISRLQNLLKEMFPGF